MELYTGTVPTASLILPTPDSTVSEVTYVKNDSVPVSLTPVTSNGVSTVDLPYQQGDGIVKVNWTLNIGETASVVETQVYEVVTPILSFAEIRTILDEDDTDEPVSDEDVYQIEAAVRHVIQAHTGQNFGKFTGVKSITGNGENYLRLPQRLISLNSINGKTYFSSLLAIRGNGWFLRYKVYGVPTIRADYDGYHENPYTGSVPITPPRVRGAYSFAKHIEFEIDGVWGWEYIPNAVREAAKLLINDYACMDIQYRDRYLTSMTAADWRIQFHEGAFSDTGNVRANQLLSEFVLRRGWAVV